MSDMISRQSAIDAVEFGITYAKVIDVNSGESKELFKEGNDALKKAVERLKELPSAEPEPKKGEWINKEFYSIGEGSAECSTCHKRSSGYKEDDGWGVHCLFYDFCPICGSCNRERGE